MVSKICPLAKQLVKRAVLSKGAHGNTPPKDLSEPCEECVMELVSQIELLCKFDNAKFCDTPTTVSLVIRSFCISLNDNLNEEDRQLLKPFALKVLNTKSTTEIEIKRAFLCADWACRILLPLILRSLDKLDQAKIMENLEPITNPKTAYAAASAATRTTARATASAATRAAAYAATRTTARATASAATRAAAYAATAYAANAARATANATAYAAVYAANTSIKKEILTSSFKLLNKLINCK